MNRSLVSGPLCRYFAVESGDASTLVDGVLTWRRDIGEALSGRIDPSLAWPEHPAFDSHVFVLPEFGWEALQLFAVYAERSDLELPSVVTTPLALDSAWRAASESKFARSHYGQLLAADLWLPGSFDFTAKVPRPDGEECTLGSLIALRDQVVFLAQRSVGVHPSSIERDVHSNDPLLASALPSLRIVHDAIEFARESGMPLVLR
ncbi:MAG: hypothetical protein AB7I19_07600 [Planctomycetota bacterium]